MKIFGKPTNDSNWGTDHKILARCEINGNIVHIKNIRDYKYRSEFDYDPAYYDKTFDASKIKSIQLGLVPFSKFKFVAHALTIFEFDNGKVAFSIETRERVGQRWIWWRTFFNDYNLIYVIADPNDVIEVRKHRKNQPVNGEHLEINQEQSAKLFLDMCKRAEHLAENPEFFHPIYNSCASNLVTHLNKVLKPKIPPIYKYFAPGYLHEYLEKKKLLKK